MQREFLTGALGPSHPNTANSLNNLARLYLEQGNSAQAEPLLQRALRIREQVVGSVHPDTASTLNYLARLYQAQGNPSFAEPLFQRALHIREQTLGHEHPDTAEAVHDLALFQYVYGNKDEATLLLKRALMVREQSLGTHHPKTLETRRVSIAWLREMERHEEVALLEGSQALSAQIGEEGTEHEGRENEANPPE